MKTATLLSSLLGFSLAMTLFEAHPVAALLLGAIHLASIAMWCGPDDDEDEGDELEPIEERDEFATLNLLKEARTQ